MYVVGRRGGEGGILGSLSSELGRSFVLPPTMKKENRWKIRISTFLPSSMRKKSA